MTAYILVWCLVMDSGQGNYGPLVVSNIASLDACQRLAEQINPHDQPNIWWNPHCYSYEAPR